MMYRGMSSLWGPLLIFVGSAMSASCACTIAQFVPETNDTQTGGDGGTQTLDNNGGLGGMTSDGGGGGQGGASSSMSTSGMGGAGGGDVGGNGGNSGGSPPIDKCGGDVLAPIGTVGTCPWPTFKSGAYCGGNHGVPGTPDTLYMCQQDTEWVEQVCPLGCQPLDASQHDRCIPESAQLIAQRLNRPAEFLIGSSEDPMQGINNDGLALDIRDVTLHGLGPTGWRSWGNGNDCFVDETIASAQSNSAIPMFTYAVLTQETDAQNGANLVEKLQSGGYMQAYWDDVQIFLDRVAKTDMPAIIHIEPHVFGYAEKFLQTDAWMQKNLSYKPGPCSAIFADNVRGFSGCWLHLVHSRVPKAIVGMPAWKNSTNFLDKMYAYWADILVVGGFERDAGCYQRAAAGDAVALASCPIPNDLDPNNYYWDDNAFLAHLAAVKEIADFVHKPVLWWQLPLGVAKDDPGMKYHYRDNRVAYVFQHPADFAHVSNLGGLGAVFGPGEATQTNLTTDDDQFKGALDQYKLAPAPLP